jgi:hypothetical protein
MTTNNTDEEEMKVAPRDGSLVNIENGLEDTA